MCVLHHSDWSTVIITSLCIFRVSEKLLVIFVNIQKKNAHFRDEIPICEGSHPTGQKTIVPEDQFQKTSVSILI